MLTSAYQEYAAPVLIEARKPHSGVLLYFTPNSWLHLILLVSAQVVIIGFFYWGEKIKKRNVYFRNYNQAYQGNWQIMFWALTCLLFSWGESGWQVIRKDTVFVNNSISKLVCHIYVLYVHSKCPPTLEINTKDIWWADSWHFDVIHKVCVHTDLKVVSHLLNCYHFLQWSNYCNNI